MKKSNLNKNQIKSGFIIFEQDVCEPFLPAGGSIEKGIGGCAEGGAIATALSVLPPQAMAK